MHLNGWQKLGVALSIAWAVAAGTTMHSYYVEQADSFAKSAYETCSKTKMLAKDSDLSQCEKEKAAKIKIWMDGSGEDVAFVALAPIPVSWLAGFILLYIARIQVAGFRAAVPWPELTRPKKWFAIFCGASLVAGLLFASLFVMLWYTHTQVPNIFLPSFLVTKDKIGHEVYVSVSGTWTRHGHGATEGSAKEWHPLQTSTIKCYRSENHCVEARASMVGKDNNILISEVVRHKVQSWTDAAIVIKDADFCAEYVYTIDLNTNRVSGRRINSDIQYCQPAPASKAESEWTYRMENGDPIFLGVWRKALPWPLRVLRSN